MKSKKIYLNCKKERAILSDVLPYETPITFSNRHFYDFLLQNKVQYVSGGIKWQHDEADAEALEHIIRILFGIEENQARVDCYSGKKIKFSYFKKCPCVSIPFRYKISHKEKEYRELAICHPRNQLQLVDLYQEFKESILYYCSVSPFSIRRPSKIARLIYHKDRTHYQKLSEYSTIEEFNKEYENLKSFFSYKNYSNVHKFYESYKYHRCEQKYNALMKLDISKCFDSIYTHSLAWALIGKEVVKENIKKSEETFPGKFDKLMRHLNYQETNGIIIGPEFSRIFAELILQHIDKKLFIRLRENGLYNKTHYEMFRYVDDYFIFYNDDSTKDFIQQELRILLREFKMSLNSAKWEVYEKPIITEVSIAKLKITDLLGDKLAYRFEGIKKDENDLYEDEEDADVEDEKKECRKGNIHVDSNKLITRFKTIIKESKVEYKDLQNYSLAVVETKSTRIIKDFNKLDSDEKKNERQVVKAILRILDFSFFIYSVSPRVNTTIRLCRIIKIYSDFLKREEANVDLRHLVFKTIYDKTLFILKKNKSVVHTQIETLYLLVTLSELGRHYRLEEDTLCNYFGISKAKDAKHPSLNYFSLTVLLFYIGEKKRYDWLRDFIEKELCKKFTQEVTFLRKDAELTLLIFDILACPYIGLDTKKTLLAKYKIEDDALQERIIEKIKKRKNWFTRWFGFDFAKELDAKKSSEVY